MQSVGIEPTLLRTCALSMRLNHSAKTAFLLSDHQVRVQLSWQSGRLQLLAIDISRSLVRLRLRGSFCNMSVAGVMVSIAAFQAVDPGSIPGPRIFCLQLPVLFQKDCSERGLNSRPSAYVITTRLSERFDTKRLLIQTSKKK